MRRRRALRLGLAAFAAALVSSCSLGSEGAECLVSEDCGPGLTCFASSCRESGIPSETIVWRVSPPPTSGLLPAAFEQGAGAPLLSLCPPSTVSGTLGFEGRARLSALGELASLPGRVERSEFLVEGAFAIDLPPGAWTLTFAPESGIPPIERRVQLARCEARKLSTIESGPIRRASFQVVIDAERDPRLHCGAHLRIHDPRDGAPLSKRLDLRAPANASCEGSREELLLPFRPPADHGFIEVRLGALDARQPTFPEQRLRFPLADEEPLDLGLLSANPGGASLHRVIVHLFDHEKRPQRLAHLVATLHPPEPQGGAGLGDEAPSDPDESEEGPRDPDDGSGPVVLEARFRSAPAVEIAQGRYELWLLPGQYSLRAAPPLSSQSGIGSCVALASDPATACGSRFEVAPSLPNEFTVALPRKIQLQGVVSGAAPDALEGASIVAVPAREGRGREARATVARSGAYRLELDAGDYDLRVEPADRLVPILHSPLSTPLLVDRTLNLELEPPSLVLGTVRRSEGLTQSPLAEAVIRAYRLRQGEEPLLLGEALSNWDGSFSLVLPGGR